MIIELSSGVRYAEINIITCDKNTSTIEESTKKYDSLLGEKAPYEEFCTLPGVQK